MKDCLLDVNVLIALIDPAHVRHDDAHDWFAKLGKRHFATCPITENGVVRIVGHPKYPNSPGPPGVVMRLLVALRELPGHVFWPDSISIADVTCFNPSKLTSHSRVTDSYLHGIAIANGGLLATMDQRLATDIVADGRGSIELI